MSQQRIAEILGATDRTVRNYLSGHSPSLSPRKKRTSKLDPFKPLIKSIIEDEPLFNCEVIFEKLKSMEYDGGITILRDYPRELRK